MAPMKKLMMLVREVMLMDTAASAYVIDILAKITNYIRWTS